MPLNGGRQIIRLPKVKLIDALKSLPLAGLPVKILLKVWGLWAKVRLHLLRCVAAQTQSGSMI